MLEFQKTYYELKKDIFTNYIDAIIYMYDSVVTNFQNI